MFLCLPCCWLRVCVYGVFVFYCLMPGGCGCVKSVLVSVDDAYSNTKTPYVRGLQCECVRDEVVTAEVSSSSSPLSLAAVRERVLLTFARSQ